VSMKGLVGVALVVVCLMRVGEWGVSSEGTELFVDIVKRVQWDEANLVECTKRKVESWYAISKR